MSNLCRHHSRTGNAASSRCMHWRPGASQHQQGSTQQPTPGFRPECMSPPQGERRRSAFHRAAHVSRASASDAKSGTSTPSGNITRGASASAVSEEAAAAALLASGHLAYVRQAVMTDLATNPAPPADAVPLSQHRSASDSAHLQLPAFGQSGEAGRHLQRSYTAPVAYSSAAAAVACLRRDSPMDPLVEARRVLLHDLAERPSTTGPTRSPARHRRESAATGPTQVCLRLGMCCRQQSPSS